MTRRKSKTRRAPLQPGNFDLEQGLRLLRAFIEIEDETVRNRLLDYVEGLAAGERRDPPGD